MEQSTTQQHQQLTRNMNDDDESSPNKTRRKRIVLIRHGRTHMNEYLSKPGSRWGDANFTDIFKEEEQLELYRDSPLSRDGIEQAQNLCETLSSTCLEQQEQGGAILNNVEIVVSSPLTRTLQTTELALLPHLQGSSSEQQQGRRVRRQVPIIALPLATERLYLISDHGSSTMDLRKRFPFVDFETEHGDDEADEWWFQVVPDKQQGDKGEEEEKKKKKKQSSSSPPLESFRYVEESNYVEWRPNEEGQTYACHGEPDFHFRSRMVALSDWLANRKESTICLVAHWGVLEWLTGGDDFQNCEMKVIDFDQVRRR
jgi:broad specificity phosphatase PhoE